MWAAKATHNTLGTEANKASYLSHLCYQRTQRGGSAHLEVQTEELRGNERVVGIKPSRLSIHIIPRHPEKERRESILSSYRK